MRAMVVMLVCAAAVAVAGAAAVEQAARPTPGPVFEKYGPVFDVTESPDDKSAVNPGVVSLARFFNLYARAGAPPKNLQLALVAHGAATKDVVGHPGYRKRYGADNPNLELMAAPFAAAALALVTVLPAPALGQKLAPCGAKKMFDAMPIPPATPVAMVAGHEFRKADVCVPVEIGVEWKNRWDSFDHEWYEMTARETYPGELWYRTEEFVIV